MLAVNFPLRATEMPRRGNHSMSSDEQHYEQTGSPPSGHLTSSNTSYSNGVYKRQSSRKRKRYNRDYEEKASSNVQYRSRSRSHSRYHKNDTEHHYRSNDSNKKRTKSRQRYPFHHIHTKLFQAGSFRRCCNKIANIKIANIVIAN